MTLESQYEFYKEVFPETTYTFGQWKTVVSGYTLEQFLNEKFPDRVSISKNPMTIEECIESPMVESLPEEKHNPERFFISQVVVDKYLNMKDKDDIELLGWVLTKQEFIKDKSLNLNCIDCFKVKYKLKIEQENIRIEKYSYGGFIGNRTYEQIYLGTCKSINELRTISKLLNI